MEGRTVIGQAQGLLVAEHNVTAEKALDLLVKESQSSNVNAPGHRHPARRAARRRLTRAGRERIAVERGEQAAELYGG